MPSRYKKVGYKKVSQKIRDRQAKAIGAEWLEPCGRGKDKTAIRCLSCGYEWAALPNNVSSGAKSVKNGYTSQGNKTRKWGCPKCARKSHDEKVTATQEQRDAEAFAVGAEWLGPPVNQFVKVPIRCLTCKYEWEASAANIRDPRRVGLACHKCKKPTGFNGKQPAMVYLAIKNTTIKVGVSGDIERESRLNKFRQQGWDIYGTWHFPRGSDALEVERSILEWWRKDLKAPKARIKMHGNGIKETASLTKVPLDETVARIEFVHQSKFGALRFRREDD